MTAPRVSVVMSVFNGERYLPAALQSILEQSFSNFELLVIDDGSSDGSPGILQACTDPRLRVLTNPTNIGLTRSLNRGLAAARGAYVARHDADDVSEPERFARQVAFLDANTSIALVGTRVRTIDEAGTVRHRAGEFSPASAVGAQWRILFGNPFVHTSVMFRREIVWSGLGGYDETFVFNQDFELWSRLLERHAAVNLRERLVRYRVHALSIVGRQDEEVRDSRMKNVVRNIEVQKRNIRRILHRDDLAEEWPPLWTSMNVGWLTGAPANPAAATGLLLEMHREFLRLHPDAAGDRDVAGGLASVLTHIANVLARTDRVAALGAFRRAIQASPSVAAHAAPRLAAVLLAGDAGVSAVRRMRTFGRRS